MSPIELIVLSFMVNMFGFVCGWGLWCIYTEDHPRK